MIFIPSENNSMISQANLEHQMKKTGQPGCHMIKKYIQGSTNFMHHDERALNVHAKRFLRAQNYVHINQSKSPLCLKANNAQHIKI